jgi:hypothetical protein
MTEEGKAQVPATRGWGDLDLAQPADIATVFVQSGLFKDSRSASAAMTKIMAGRELGLGAFESMQAFDVVEGKVRMTSHLLAALVRKSGTYDFRVLEWTGEVCNIEFRMRTAPDQLWADMEHLGYGYFDDAMRERAGLRKQTASGKPSNWGKHPDAMMWARAISRGVNAHCPDVTGGIRVYTEGDSFDGGIPQRTTAPQASPLQAQVMEAAGESPGPGPVLESSTIDDPPPKKKTAAQEAGEAVADMAAAAREKATAKPAEAPAQETPEDDFPFPD